MPRIGPTDRFERCAIGCLDHEMLHDANPPLAFDDVTDRFVTRRIRTGRLHVKRNVEAEVMARVAKSAERQAGPHPEERSRTSADASRRLAKDKVFAVAADLFYRKGIHTVGVE